MRNRIIFLCNTPYQLLAAVNIRMQIYQDCDSDIIITDHINNFESLISGCMDSKLFIKCYKMYAKKYIWKNSRYLANYSHYKNLIEKLLPHEEICNKKNIYSHYLFSNIGGVAPILGNYLRVKNNSLKIQLFEDGFSTYTDAWLRHIKNKKKLSAFFKTSVGFSEALFVYHPELIEAECDLKILTLPLINDSLCDQLNIIFRYNDCIDMYKEKYIFFEESFVADKKNINDFEIVGAISDFIGKEQIIIKIHPRNPINRFENAGYKTNKNTFIPWEVIALNIDLSEKIMITISSSSPITTSYNFNKNSKANIFLYDMEFFNKGELSDAISMFDKIVKAQNTFYFPKNLYELENILQKIQ